MQDMVALAFACDLTRVASISMSFEGGGSTGGLIPTWLGFNATPTTACRTTAATPTSASKYNQIIQLVRRDAGAPCWTS